MRARASRRTGLLLHLTGRADALQMIFPPVQCPSVCRGRGEEGTWFYALSRSLVQRPRANEVMLRATFSVHKSSGSASGDFLHVLQPPPDEGCVSWH